jgi:UDP-N-acetylmuramate--alanine ligase
MSTAGERGWRDEIRRWISTPESQVHLMGVGGIGMSGVARLLAARGLHVSGCDGVSSRLLDGLRTSGIPVEVGHDPAHLTDVDWAIFSPALPPNHPERLAAAAKQIPLFRRGQVLPVLAEKWKTLAVSGTHGKTTTSSMIAHLMRASGNDASWCIGGELPPDGEPAGIGTSEWLVIEADESDATLAHYHPEIAVITNIEFDHMEHYDAPKEMVECFRTFARQTRGPVIVCAEDPEAAAIGAEWDGISYGFSSPTDFCADSLDCDKEGTHFTVRTADGQESTAFLPLTGRHNVLNALGAIAACVTAGSGLEAACEALASFSLPRRRFERVAAARGIQVLADYAHHPSEIRALIDAVQQAGAQRIWAVFQPHRFTRTLALGKDFPPAFDGVAGVILTPVYAASEPPLAGGTSEDLLQQFQAHSGAPAEFVPGLEDAADQVIARWKSGDWILLIGAGDVEDLGPMLKQRLEGSLES